MRKKASNVLCILFALLSASPALAQGGLKDAVGKHFLIGTSLNQWQSDGQDAAATAVVRKHFNCATAENCMKMEVLQPAEGIFDFRVADKFVNYCKQNGLTIIGHNLCWHSQAPDWMFTDSWGRPVSKEVLKSRLEKHIATVVGHYKGQIHGWDVVNEAIEDDGSWRQSPLYKILGEEFIEIAFRAAHEADPNMELYYNDYSMSKPGKREAVCRLVKNLKAKGLRIDGVGMQSHNGMDYPDLAEYEKSIDAFAACGVKVMITELDLNVLPNPEGFSGADINQNFELKQKYNPYTAGLPADMAKKVNDRWMQFFKIYHKHRSQISRVTLWGISDANSWLNDFPVHGRTNYGVLFDRCYGEKPVLQDIINLYK